MSSIKEKFAMSLGSKLYLHADTQRSHVNKTLLLSLKQDLLSLNSSIERLTREKDVFSWLFPTREHRFVNKFIKDKRIIEKQDVKLILELIIDRLYVGIKLIQTVIQDKIKTGDSEYSLILQPQQMTIGCSFENLRKTVESLFEQMSDVNALMGTSDANATKKSAKIQTEVTSLSKCDSCVSALSCMKNLLNLFEIHKNDIYQNDQAQFDIYGLTQFGCMMQTTATIETNLQALLAKLIDKQKENEKLRHKIKTLNKDITIKTGKIISLEQECAASTKKDKRNSSEIADLKTQIDTLNSYITKDETEINYLNTCIKSLKSVVSMHEADMQRLRALNANLTDKVERMAAMAEQYVRALGALERKLGSLDKEHRGFAKELKLVSACIDGLDETLGAVGEHLQVLERKMIVLRHNSTGSAAKMASDFKGFQEKIQQLAIQTQLSTIKAPEEAPKRQIKGNPIEDLSRQIEENKEKIVNLQNENAKLEIIISKVKLVWNR
ncbi:unnamed protein product [Phyllotreta striolata]|uniref:Uncharacterized protein n=1 Tax=Phyllotreta striolata TaxID=444603 RepID=A0A9N9TT96_PHYSR|nr:unnamed protein product [Phyllotreta striolata]